MCFPGCLWHGRVSIPVSSTVGYLGDVASTLVLLTVGLCYASNWSFFFFIVALDSVSSVSKKMNGNVSMLSWNHVTPGRRVDSHCHPVCWEDVTSSEPPPPTDQDISTLEPLSCQRTESYGPFHQWTDGQHPPTLTLRHVNPFTQGKIHS